MEHTPLYLSCLFLLLKLSSFPDFVRESNADMYFLCHFQLISKPRLGSGAGGGGRRGRARAAAAQSLIMCTIFRSSIMVNNLLLFETGNRKRLFLNNKIKFWLKKRGKNKIGKKLITYKKDLYSHRKLQRILKLFSCC